MAGRADTARGAVQNLRLTYRATPTDLPVPFERLLERMKRSSEDTFRCVT